MNRPASVALSAAALVALLGLSGCSAAPADLVSKTPSVAPATSSPVGDAAGTRLAFGLYDQADGTAEAYGVLEWRDLEGGFWAVIGGTEASGDVGKVLVVIANIAKDDPAYAKLAGKTVRVSGTLLEGASIRMAGPELNATAIAEITDTPGAAE